MAAPALRQSTARAERATERVPLGRSTPDGPALMVPRLALGTGSGGWARESEQTQLGQREFVRMLRHGVERGAAFIDTADLYGAHLYVKATIAELRREDLILLSKIWFAEGAPKMTPTETARPEVERFLRELGTDYLDAVLIHCVTDARWPTQQARMRDELSELKQRGVVRAVGCSCHTLAALRVAAQDPWVDVLFARINPGHQRMDPDGTVEQVADTLRLARANGKGVVGMKIYGAGHWRTPEQRRQSLELALTTGVTDAISIGHVSCSQIDDTIDNMNAVLAGAR